MKRIFFPLMIWLWLPIQLAAQDTVATVPLAADSVSAPPADTVSSIMPDMSGASDPGNPAPPEMALQELGSELTDGGEHHFSLRSPYHTIVTHLHFLQEDHWFPDSAAMALNIKDPEGKQARELAIQLKKYMDGAGYFIDIYSLPQDPNYVDSISGKHMFAPIPEVPEVFVYKVGKKWVYSYRTVEAIPGLYNSVYPFGTLDWLPEWSRQKLLGLALWKYFGVLFLILFSILLHRLLSYLVTALLERVLKRFVKEGKAHEFFERAARPVSLAILCYVLWELVPALQLPISMNKWLILGFRIMIPVFFMMIALQVVNLFMAYFEKKAEKTESAMDDQLAPLLKNLLQGIVVIGFTLVILSQLRVNITALLGGVAFGGLAFALAAQDTVKNLFGSFLIFVDKPFQIGDWIVVDGHEGVVEEVRVRSTRIRTFANSVIYIPNGSLADSAINNMGLRAYRRFVTRIGLTYDTPPDLIEVFVDGIRELIRNHPTTRKDYFEVHFNEMGDSSLQILLYTFFEVPSWTDELAGKQKLLLGIMRLAERLGVSFAFPTQTLHIETFPEKKGNSPAYPHQQEDYRDTMRKFVEEWKVKASEVKERKETKAWGGAG